MTLSITLLPQDGQNTDDYLINGEPYTPAHITNQQFFLIDTQQQLRTKHNLYWLTTSNYPVELQVFNFERGVFSYTYDDIFYPVNLQVTPIPEPSSIILTLSIILVLCWRRLR